MGADDRRFEARSSEDYDPDSGICSVEVYAAYRDRYRVAPTGHIPMLWPYDQRPCDDKARAIIAAVENASRALCSELGITLERVSAQNLRSRGNWKKPRDTMIFVTKDEPSLKWEGAANEIQVLLDAEIKAQGHPDKISPEVRNFEQMYRHEFFPILPNSPEHLLLQGREGEVGDIVLAQMIEVTSITFEMRGRRGETDYEKLQPVIWVTVKPHERFYWELANQNTKEKFEKVFGPAARRFMIEIYPGVMKPAIDDLDPLTPMNQPKLTLYPSIGSSIGPVGAEDSGSLGAYVWFQKSAKAPREACFLTCFHVIENGAPNAQMLKRIAEDGIGRGGEPASTIRVRYPGTMDARRSMTELSQKVAANSDPGGRSQRGLDVMARWNATNGVGTVIYASGYSRLNDKGHRMDWAIVKLDPQVQMQSNKPPEELEIGNNLLGGKGWQPEKNATISGFSPFVKFDFVIKRGRTSEVTTGYLYILKGICADRHKKTSLEWVVIKEEGTRDPFVRNGDSGSMVHTTNCQWVGMVFAIDPHEEHTFITPVQEIVDDIKEWTNGGIITFP